MAGRLALVFFHIMLSIVWVGYALFWAILTGPVARAYRPEEAEGVLRLVNRASWPPAKVPIPFRLKFAWVGWGLLLLLALTGSLLALREAGSWGALFSGPFLAGRFGGLLGVKLLFVVVAAGFQVRIASRPGPRIAYANLGAAVTIVALSALLARSVGK
jgi:hypothetical protein